MSDALYALYARILELPRPVLAALDGPAIGGGLQLAITCDLRIAAPGAWLQARGPGHGLAVAAWGLPTLVGRSRALDLCLTGRRIDAEEALAIGLVDRVEDDPAPRPPWRSRQSSRSSTRRPWHGSRRSSPAPATRRPRSPRRRRATAAGEGALPPR